MYYVKFHIIHLFIMLFSAHAKVQEGPSNRFFCTDNNLNNPTHFIFSNSKYASKDFKEFYQKVEEKIKDQAKSNCRSKTNTADILINIKKTCDNSCETLSVDFLKNKIFNSGSMARALPECLLLCDVMANYYRGYIEGLREANNGKKMNDCSGVVDTSSRNIMKKNDFETIQENLKTKSSTIQK